MVNLFGDGVKMKIPPQIFLPKDYYIDGQNTQLIFFSKNVHWGREVSPPNYTPGMDVLDNDLL